MKKNHKLERIRKWLAGWLVMIFALFAAVPAAAAVLHLDGSDIAMHDTAGYLERLDDPRGMLDPAQANAVPGWSALPGSLNAGFTSHTVWLRLTLQVDAVRPYGWMLRLGNALLDDVTLYTRDGAAWTPLGRSGENVQRRDWPVDYRTPMFHFSPSSTGEHVLLLRLQSKNAMVTRLELWQREDFDNRSRRDGLLFGMYAGFYLLLIGLHAIFWRTTRAPMSGLFLAYICICVFNEVLSLGFVQQLSGLPVTWSDPILGVGIALSVPVSIAVALRQMDLPGCHPALARWMMRCCTLLGLISAALVLSGRYAWGMQPVQLVGVLLIPVLSGLAAYLLWRGWRPARYFLLVFAPFYVGVLIAFLRNLGLVPVNGFTEQASTLGTMAHMLLLSLIIIGRHERKRRAREVQQANLAAELAMQHSLRLETEVAERTADLSAEIGRRERVEGELRAALESERQVLATKRDFVAMVSHEFRTPLAIIGTSAQQLGRNLDAPVEKSLQRCRNIRDASLRLLALVDEYLTDDRMREPRAELHDDVCDLRGMLAELAQPFVPGRIRCTFESDSAYLRSDAGLLNIALRNLLANADRYAAAGEFVDVTVRDDGETVRIDVSNPGTLIPEY